MDKTPTFLANILKHKRVEIIQRKKVKPLVNLKKEITNLTTPRPFVQAIRQTLAANNIAVIAEIKKASPSKGIIRENFNPVEIAKSYSRAKATCLSVLTDEKFFQGHDDYIRQVKEACDLPVIRKDFIIDSYQVYESRAIGADCILLIVTILTDQQLLELMEIAQQLQLDVLVEVHTENELKRALKLDTPLIGINNRDLYTFKTDLNTTLFLKSKVPNNKIIITESGINTTEDIKLMRHNNIHTFLIGESLMREQDPGEKLKKLIVSSC